jgi:AcrR family transcriptional regulator
MAHTIKHRVGRRPRREGDGDTKKDLFAAARRVFAAKGYDGTSVQEIAQTARVNKAMIYYHFRDKRALYRAVLADSLDALKSIWECEVFRRKTATAREKIRAFVEGFIEFHFQNEELRVILTREYSETGAQSENLRWIAKRYFSKEHAALAAILRQGMAAGELRKTDPLMAVVMLMGMIIHSFMFAPLCPFVHGKKVTVSAAGLSEFTTALFFDGLAAHGVVITRKAKAEKRSPQRKQRKSV